MCKGLGDWYFIVPGTDDTFSYMEGIYTHRLTPDYSIEMGKRSTKPGYVVLNLPAVYSLTYQVMDLLYQQVPVANLYMEHGTVKRSMDHSYERRTFEWCFSGIS
ncbi:hypothetical protein M3221_14920 [Domibacillus indicus]|uniref:hypothetical protein n=1 Tax=Domibacillus indicus TaxID=1437523 RepID=UPI0020401D11|nr:hypothetical protein [Domibacillus indicus]MCM3789684.1 hypothetical protein [Domibacillus indicus]